MRKTKGDREPPEHGLKRYWKRNSKAYKKSAKITDPKETSGNSSLDLHLIPSDEELLAMGSEAASNLVRRKARLARFDYRLN